MNINTMSYAELQEHIEKSIRLLKLKAYGQGYEQGRLDQKMSDRFDKSLEEVRKVCEEKTRQEWRDEIVARAKVDIEGLKISFRDYYAAPLCDGSGISDTYNVEFVVNKEKRIIFALMRGAFSEKIRARGIAKCHPDECFNVHIGKAIALRRALGKRVPDEYLNAPQPTEARVGDVINSDFNGIKMSERTLTKRYKESDSKEYGRAFRTDKMGGWIGDKQFKIIDDSREETNDD